MGRILSISSISFRSGYQRCLRRPLIIYCNYCEVPNRRPNLHCQDSHTHTHPKKKSNTIHACLSMHFACGATNIKKLQIRAPAPPSSVRGRLLSGSSSNAVPLKDQSWSVKMISAFASCVGLTSLTSSKESLLLSFTKVGILFLA